MATNTTKNTRKTKGMTEAQMDKITEKTGNALANEDKIEIKIPKSELKGDNVIEIGVNGYNYLIQRGEKVKVPKTVAEILEQAGYI